ncbi:MAG: glycosyltransferase family 2 protein [Verrucomicrobiota bacterium]
MTATVIIVTLNRPDCLSRALEALLAQEHRPEQVVVVDSSRDDRTRRVMERFPDVLYLSVPEFFGRMTTARNAGLFYARGEIIAFLDDDAYPHPGWLKNLLAAYDSPKIGAVGGRALNGQLDEERRGRDNIGRLKPNGFLTGNFAADPGHMIEVDHLIGCNLSIRREALARLGGFRDDFRGISGLCEDTDMCLRVKMLGYTLRFQPAACVDHVGAPQAIGKRFDSRYQYFHRRNGLVLLVRNFGCSPIVLRFLFATGAQMVRECFRNVGGAFARLAASAAGMAAGMAYSLLVFRPKGMDPVRRDPAGQAIRAALETRAEAPPCASSMPALFKD